MSRFWTSCCFSSGVYRRLVSRTFMILRADRMKSTCWFPVDTTDRATVEKCHVIETSRPQDGNGPITPFLSLRYRRATVCRITGKMDKRCQVSLFAWWKPRCSVKRVKFTVKSTLQERVCSMMAYGLPFLQKCRQPGENDNPVIIRRIDISVYDQMSTFF